jgi:hypothetical protein
MTEGICQLGIPSLGIHVYTKLFHPICSIKWIQKIVQYDCYMNLYNKM